MLSCLESTKAIRGTGDDFSGTRARSDLSLRSVYTLSGRRGWGVSFGEEPRRGFRGYQVRELFVATTGSMDRLTSIGNGAW